MESEHELEKILEALLFVSTTPLDSGVVSVLLDKSKREIEEAMTALGARYLSCGSSLQVIKEVDGYRLATRPEFASYVEALLGGEETTLSNAALETLSIIAFKQPVTRAEIDKIRGVMTSGVLEKLIGRNLVKVVGHKDAPGRPRLYGTTNEFFHHFGLSDLRDLRTYLKGEETEVPIEAPAPGEQQLPFGPVSDDYVEPVGESAGEFIKEPGGESDKGFVEESVESGEARILPSDSSVEIRLETPGEER
jgi:segregation and condensation protein B